MNENAKKWVSALRSNKFKKAKGQLHYTEKKKDYFSCLGVACVLYKEACNGDVNLEPLTEEVFNISEASISKRKYHSYDKRTGGLPQKVIDWLGLTDSAGTFIHEANGSKSLISLINLNDTDDDPEDQFGNKLPPEPNYSFKEIANIIEQEPEGLFRGEE